MYLRIVFAGHLGRDPEMRYLPSGTPVTNFSVATNRRWTGSDGEKQEEVVWLRVSCFGRLAETTNEYLAKGRAVLVEGRLRPDPDTGNPRIWTGNDGVARASFEVSASRVVFLGGNGDGRGSRQEPSDEVPPVDGGEETTEIPF